MKDKPKPKHPGWGGRRPGAGKRKAEAKAAAAAAEPKKEKAFSVDLVTALSIIEQSKLYAKAKNKAPENNPYKLPVFPPAATPPKDLQMAMDSNIGWAGTQWSGNILANISAEGLLFLGYPYLAELAQRPEYRVISETIATEMVRKWIKFKGTGNDAKNKADRIKEITDEFDRLEVRDRFRDLAVQDGFFGRSHLFMDFGADLDDPQGELTTDIGDGRDAATKAKVAKGSLRKLKTVEAVWTYPTTYNAVNPLKDDWYNPQVWYVMGKQIHRSRLLTFIGHPVSDLLKPAYSFGGLSLSQMAKPYVDIWLQTRASVGALIHSFSVMVLMTDMQANLQNQNSAGLMTRVAMFNALRDNMGTFVLNKATEDFKNVSASLAGLHELQSQAQEHMMSVARIPAVKFTGIQPAGLNASSEGEMRAFYDTIGSYQQAFFRPNLERVVNLVMMSLWGEVDDEISWEFEPLWAMTEKEKGEMRKSDAETAQVHIDSGVLNPEEERERVANDPDTLYPGLSMDEEDLPDLREEEEAGLEPEGGRPQPLAEAGPGVGKGPDKQGGERGGEDAAIIPFPSTDVDPFADWVGDEGGFEENDHPRGKGGKFSSKGGGAGGEKQKLTMPQFGLTHAPSHGGEHESWFGGGAGAELDPDKLTKVGAQMGSNPGGVYADAKGKKFYVKQGKSPEHVKNELIAASLYDLAGAPTLNYRPVKGGGHIATEMAKLDKDNASKLSPEEIKRAQKDFVAHAWLANWDAVGMGGDNLGTVRGKPTPLDMGGALEYRAQGEPKGNKFGTKVGEINTLRDAAMNPDSAGVFGSMSEDDLKKSAERVTSIPDEDVRDAVIDDGGTAALADKLIARKKDIAERFGLPTYETDKAARAARAEAREAERKAKLPKSEGDPKAKTSTVVFDAGADTPKTLNGTAFKSWQPPADWAEVDGQADIDEPDFDADGLDASSGVIIREPDGRVWLMRPKGGYGGYDHTFPKGRIDKGLSFQANAIKEAFEETGLKVKIKGFAGDHEGDTTKTRYYIAERETGNPSDATDESEAVVLAPAGGLDKFLNRDRDRKIAKEHIGQDAAGPRSLYANRPLLNGGEIVAWARRNGIAKTLRPEDMHVTLAFSRDPLRWPQERQDALVVAGGTDRAVERLGDEGAVALIFGSGDLEERWKELCDAGASWDHEGFRPHITFTMDDGDVDLSAIDPYDGRLEFGPEKFQEIGGRDKNWAARARATLVGDDASFVESDHPREKGGKFTSKGGGAGAGEKTFKNFSPSKSGTEHGVQVNKVLMSPAKSGTTYRWMVNMLVKEVPNFVTNEQSKAAWIKNLKLKIAESWGKEKTKAEEKGDFALAAKIGTKMYDLGWDHTGGKGIHEVSSEMSQKSVTAQIAAQAMKENPKLAEIVSNSKKYPPATEGELAKAKKNVALQMQYVPNGVSTPEGEAMLAKFNAKYAGKTITDPKALQQKVDDFKDLNEQMAPLKQKALEQEKKNLQSQAAKLTAAMSPEDAKNANVLAELYSNKSSAAISMAEAAADVIKEHNLKITPQEGALIKAYCGSSYGQVNDQLRQGKLTETHWKYAMALTKALDKMPIYTKTVKRGADLPAEVSAKYQPGFIVPEAGFTSAGKTEKLWGNYTYTIHSKTGRDLSSFNPHEGGGEVVFKPQTYFKVISRKGYEIEMEEIVHE